MATIEQFAEMTRRVIAKDGFEDFLPTLLLPSKKEVRCLQGVPPEVAQEQAALSWASRVAAAEPEYLVAFKVSDATFKIVRWSGGASEESVYEAFGV